MRPTSLPSGPLGWTTFWTLARIVRFASSNTLTVMRSRPGEAKAVPSRRTLRTGSGRRSRLRPQGAFAKVRIDFDDIGLSPNRPRSHHSKAETRGRPRWAPRGYNHADALVRCVVSRRPRPAAESAIHNRFSPPYRAHT